MKRGLKLSVLCVCMVVVSCKSADTAKTHIINFPEAIDNIGIVNLSDVAKSIRYVPLETRGDALVGQMTRTSYDGTHIIVADLQSGIINVFDNSGKFVKSINKRGRGPEEFSSSISNISFFDGNIVVMTIQEVLEYDMAGNFIGRVATPKVEGYNVMSPAIIGENRYAAILVDFATGNKEYCAVVYDSLLVVEQLIATPSDTDIQMMSPPPRSNTDGVVRAVAFLPTKLVQNSDKFFLFQPESREILSIENPNIIDTAYVIEYGGYKMPEGLMPREAAESRYLSLSSFIESEKFLFMTINSMATIVTTLGSRMMNFLYDKQTKKTSLLYDKAEGKKGFKDDIAGGPEFWPGSLFGKKTVLSNITALSLIEFAESNTVSKELEKIISAIDENSNPVIAIVELK